MSLPRNPPVPRLAPANSITLVGALDAFGKAIDPGWTGEEIQADTAPEPSDDDLAHRAFAQVTRQASDNPRGYIDDDENLPEYAILADLHACRAVEFAARRRWKAAAIAMSELVTIKPPRTAVSVSGNVVIPSAIADAGEHAVRRFLEFFAATLRNRNTREAYYRAACSFFAWLEQHAVGELADIEPMHVSLYIETLQTTAAKPTVKQHLAAIRHLFDWLVTGQLLATNPAHSVRGPKHVVRRGKTPVLTADEARRLLDSIDTTTLVGMRDRALIAVMTFAFARIGAVVGMRVEDYYPEGKRWWVRLHEKGGKRHEMPAHHKLENYIDEYVLAAGIRDESKGPLFRSAIRKTGVLTTTPMNRVDAYRMIRRRAAEAGFKQKLGCHVFRATGITAYLEAGGTLENAQAMAAHESPRTTKLYDRTSDAITLDEVERITI